MALYSYVPSATSKENTIMKTTEIKEEINKIIDKLPDEILGDLLEYLQQVEKNTTREIPADKEPAENTD